MRKIPTLQSLFQRQADRKRLRNRSVFRKLLGIETLESRALLASDAIQINSLSDLATYYDAGTNSYSIGEESTSSVTIADGIVIDTSSALGQAGSITIQGDEITIGNNVQITANGPLNTATGLEQDGAIKLLSENVLTGFNNSAVMQIEDLVRAFQGQKSTITVGTSTVIEGGAITISTDSGNELWGDFIASQVHLASKVFLEAIQKPDPLALPITVQVWEPVSEITIGKGTSIQSSSEVSLSATATANAFGKAVWNTLSEKTGKSPLGFALGEFVNIAKANIDVSSNATISAEGDIEINTKVDNVTELEVATIENLGITQTNPKANSFAYGSTEVISKSTILLDVGSQVVSSDGNVTIEAEATDENSVSSKATSYRDGFVAIGGAFAYSKATVTVDVKGTVTSGIVETETSSPENLIFNPAFVVDFATNSLVFDEDVPYKTGDQVLFDSQDGSTIPGLVPGTVYYAIVDTTNPKSLQLSLTSAGATNGTEISWAVSYPTLTVGGYPLPITVVDSVYSNTILFSYDTLPDTTTAVFTDGQLVTYSPVTGQFLGVNDASGNLLGALPAGLYTIKIATSPQPSLYPLAIQLIDQAGLIGPSGNVVVLNTNSFFTTASGTVVQIASTDLQLSQITLNFSTLSDSQDGQAPLPTPPAQTPTQSALFTNGQPLVFTSGLGNQIANLTNAASYWAVVDSSTPGVIRLASNYEQSVAANPSVQNFVPELKTVSNQAAVQSVANSFTDVNFVTTYTLQTNNAYSIWNNADGGTFTITLLGPDGAVTTTDLAWNVSSADLQSALNSLSGIVSTVSGQGTQLAPWIVSILFQFEIGTVEPGTGLVFTNDPNIADGTAVIYLGNAAKPIEGLTVGSTYYAYNGTNPSFDTDIPQYVLNLRTTQDTTAPVIQYELVQSMTDSQGDQYSFLSSIASQNLLTLNLPSSVVIEPIDGSALTGGTLTSLTLAANTATTLYSFATSGTFTLIATDAQGNTQTTSSLAYNASAIEVETALNALGILPVQVTGLGVMGILDFPTNNYESDLNANNTVNVGSGTNIISGRDVQIGSVPGINSAVAYSFHNIDGGKGKTDTVTDGVTESNVVTLDGTIVAGQDHELEIDIQESGNSFTMAINGGSPQTFPVSGNGSLQTVSPTASQTFVPFQVAVNDAYDPAELLVGLDPTVQDVLSLSLSSIPVSAITLQGIKAVGGRVLIQAGSLNGTGTVSAYSPEISLVNQSDAYLLLESLTIPQTYGMGQIDLTGGATLPGTLIFQPSANAPTVLVSMTGTGPVGNNASGPALGLLGNITNTDGTVSISNSEGAFVQSGTILAESVTIDVPNASYIVNTPAAYFGTSGDIQDYWGNSVNLIPDGNFESSQWSSESGSFLYNPTQLGWTFSGAGITGNNSGFTSGNPVAPIGSQVAFVQTKGTITRELAGLIPGSSYQLDFYAAQRAGYSPQTLSLSVGSLNIGTVAPSGTSYLPYSLSFVAPNPETTPVANTSMLTLSTGASDTATAAWNPNLISIPSSGTLTFEFTYQASGNKGADGVAMVFQNQGGYALGQTGGNLGYVGILGDTAAYQINLYNGHVQGSNFVTTNSAGTYLTTGGVNFNSGNPIQVTLVYDADAQTVTESLSDPIANATFTRTYTGINLASVLGTTATFGFTGGEGSVTSIQTISNFTMTNSTTNSITGFAGWGYVTPLTLTITGLNPGGTDETAFIDGLILSQNATGFTPGLNWYSPYSSTAGAYSANVAASSAANDIFGGAPNALTSIEFSNLLYNMSQTGISSFTNANVSVGSVGSNYPSSANNNWNTSENGTGVMFFGSQIPYLTGTPLSAGIYSGSNYLTTNTCASSTGYLDTLSNAQTYSPLASGNPNDSGLNVTQGTGPQNGTNGAQRGVFPMVPYNVNGTVPTQATVASPQSRTLGGSITAGNISVTALYIDINGPINVGPVTTPISVTLGLSLQTMVEQFQQSFDAGTQLNPELSSIAIWGIPV